MFLHACKQTCHISCTSQKLKCVISKVKQCYNVKPSTYHFYEDIDRFLYLHWCTFELTEKYLKMQGDVSKTIKKEISKKINNLSIW